jgi:hypothetical protein
MHKIRVHYKKLYHPEKMYVTTYDGEEAEASLSVKDKKGDKIDIWIKTPKELIRAIITKTKRLDEIRIYEPTNARPAHAFKSLWIDYGLVTRLDYKGNKGRELSQFALR